LLKDIGVSSAGHRLRTRNAIVPNAASPVTATEVPASSAERHLLAFEQQLGHAWSGLLGFVAVDGGKSSAEPLI
jgi:hypothetical protein